MFEESANRYNAKPVLDRSGGQQRAFAGWRSAMAWVFLLVFFHTASAWGDRPNIVLVVADDLGYGELGCYGQRWIKTPNIDSLAANGMRLTQFYAGSPVCAPSRCVLLTGKHTGHAFIRDNGEVQPEGQRPLAESELTISQQLHDHGYHCGAIGKWGLGMVGSVGDPNRRGFDLFFGYNCQRHAHNHYPKYLWKNDQRIPLAGNDRTLNGAQHSQELFVEQAVDFIQRNQQGPFFLYLPFAIPHLSIQTTDKFLAMYDGKIPEAPYEHHGYLKHPTPRAGYAGMISQMDDGVGRIMAALDQMGLRENTLVIFTSDNGPTYQRLGGSDSDFFHSSGELRGRKGSVWEGGLRVPCIANWPSQIEGGTTSNHISAFCDIMPTLLDVAGISVPDNIDGISFLPELTGKAQGDHQFLYWEFPSYGGQQAVRMGKWKAVRRDLQRENKTDLTTSLYDLSIDPGESNDVSAEHPEILHQLTEMMQREHVDSAEFPFPALDNSPVSQAH